MQSHMHLMHFISTLIPLPLHYLNAKAYAFDALYFHFYQDRCVFYGVILYETEKVDVKCDREDRDLEN